MYNRYIPMEDGTFRRQSLPDSADAHDRPAGQPAGPSPGPPPGPPFGPPPEKPCPKKAEPIGPFLGHLLPKGLDTEDLIVVLLLLLISENCSDTPNTALVTMLIYLFQ